MYFPNDDATHKDIINMEIMYTLLLSLMMQHIIWVYAMQEINEVFCYLKILLEMAENFSGNKLLTLRMDCRHVT